MFIRRNCFGMNFYNFGLFCVGIFVICALSSRCQDPPNAINVSTGESVGLYCTFDHQVEACWWTRDGHRVVTSDRYRFTDGEPYNTASCTIQITNADPVHDPGHWECHYREQIHDEARKKNGFQLSVSGQPPGYKEFLNVQTTDNGAGYYNSWITCIVIAISFSFHAGLRMI